MMHHLGVLFLLLTFGFFFESAVSLHLVLDDDNDNKTVDVLDYLIPTVFSENQRCKNDSLFYRQELSKFTVWATDMFDASSKFPSGIFIGSIFDTGNFDECVNVKLPGEIGFSGQHCMAHFKISPLKPLPVKNYYSRQYDDFENIFNMSTWLKVANYRLDDSKQSRDESYFTFCLPSTCTAKDLEEVLKKKIQDIDENIPFNLEVEVNSKNCQVSTSYNFTTPDFIYMGVISILVLIGIISTLYDINSNYGNIDKFTGTLHEVLKSFSYSNTCSKLLSFKKNENGFDCINGIKVITMFVIIMGHRLMFHMSGPLYNPTFLEKCYSIYPCILLANGTVVVNTFFTVSGFLGCYIMLMELDKRKKMLPVGFLYLHRFLRLTPAYAIVIGFYCTIFFQLGQGPFWTERIQVEQERCLESWWTNILYINNYVHLDNICMFQSWYVNCEMHFFIVLPFLVYLIWKKPKFGVVVTLLLIMTSFFVAFVVILIEKDHPILFLYAKYLRDVVTNFTFKTTYIKTHMRLSPYLTGILAGYLKYQIKTTGYKIPKLITYGLWTTYILGAFAIYTTAYIVYIPVEEEDHVFSAIYGSLQHLLWGIAIGWLIIAVSEGKGSWIEPILSWKPWMFLSKITYTTYLCHGAIQLYAAGTLRGPTHSDIFQTIHLAVSDIAFSYFVGFILTLMIEGPMMSLEKIIFRMKSSEDSDKNRKKAEMNRCADMYIPRIPKDAQ